MPSLSHFIDSNCVAPCWNGILPGETDEATAVSLLTAVGHGPVIVRGGASITIDTKTYKYDTYFYRLNNGDTLDLALKDGKVARIQIGIHADRPSLDNVVRAFGAPDLICSMSVTVPDEAPRYETHMVYLEKGMWLLSYANFRRTDDDKATIRPDMEIGQVTFFPPRADLRLVMVQMNDPVRILDTAIDCLQRWKGFKSYQYYH